MKSFKGMLTRLLALSLMASSAWAEDDFFLGLSYGREDASAQTLDIYLPPGASKPVPLLIYVPGGFWGPLDKRFARLAEGTGRLRFNGVAVAIVRTRPMKQADALIPLHDLVQAIAWLRHEAKRYGFDTARIFLMGHSSGGNTVSRLVFSEKLLRQEGLDAEAFAGVITLSGLHDLQGPANQGRAGEMITAAFPKSPPPIDIKAGSNRPRFLVLAAERDLDGFVRDAQDYALRLHAAKLPVIFQIVPGANHQSMADLGASGHFFAREVVLGFVNAEPMDERLDMLVDVDNRIFFEPPFSTEPFWTRFSELIRTYPVDDRFRQFLFRHIEESRYQLAGLPLKTYHAIPVVDLVKAIEGRGDWLVSTNVRNERYHWPIREMLEYDPVIVVGIDDEKNLFHYGIPYRNRREYSWIDRTEPMPVAFRALGAMVHFRKAPSKDLILGFSADMSLTADGFHLEEHSPMQEFPDLPDVLKPVMTYANGCFSCHTIRGVGSLSFHNRFDSGAEQGGRALPLEDYPPEVWKRFVFQQPQAAGLIGVIPNLIAEPAQAPLYELVSRARMNRP
jgi:acetyl esterase/lipase